MASRRHETDVLVVGAGPVGLALGRELTRLGVDVTVAGAGEDEGDVARLGVHPTGPVRPSWRLDACAAYQDRVVARVHDPVADAGVLVSARYLVRCDPVAATSGPTDQWHDRVFRCGDQPGAGRVALATGTADAVNLGWKLAATLHGWAGDGLLASYREERWPVDGRGRRTAELNRYRSSLIIEEGGATESGVEDPSAPGADDDETRPGRHAPEAPGLSARDLAGPGFLLLRLVDRWSPRTDLPHPPGVPALRAAFAAAGVPLTVTECRDPEMVRRYRRPFVLLRPDGHVAWRGWRPPTDPSALVDRIRGAGPEPAPVRTPTVVGVSG